jgi:hypothetical protein
MSWKLDNIDFSTYGVYVSKASGLFDLPRVLNEPNKWLDEDGEDYWHDITDQKYDKQIINLNCFILNDTYAGFITQIKSFYDALMSENKRLLSTPYTTSNIECYLEKGISLDRKTRYIGSKQAGVFILTLTVPGDPDFLSLNINRYYTYNTIATVLTRDLKISKTLQGDFYATFSFESNKKLDIQFFDEIDINSNGVGIERYYLETEPEFKKVSTNKYVYNIRAEHISNWFSHSQFLNLNKEADFYYFANLEEIFDLILWNHNRKYPGQTFFKGSIAATERRNHKFSGENCLSVLRRICQEYELEYEFQFHDGLIFLFDINIKDQVANDKAITLQYGKGNGLYEITRGAMLKDELCTVLHAYGAARNLKPDYRGGLKRLSFTNNPLTKNYGFTYADGEWGVREKTVYFDEIYPNRTATVTDYYQKLPDELSVAEKASTPEGLYIITDSTLDFDLNDYLMGGLTAKIRIKTGDLAGVELEIARYYDDTKQIYLIPYKDERGRLWPNDTFQPAIGDEYTLVDIDQPGTYVTTAETALEAAATDYINEFSSPKFPYRVVTDPAYLKANPTGFEVGDRLTVVDTDYNISGLFRISALVYDVYKQRYEFTLSDVVILSNRKKTEARLAAVERAVADTKKDTVESMRKEKETTNELRNRLLDPTDDKFNADRNVRDESIDPRMLSYDAGVPQFSLRNALVETNVDDDPDKVVVGAGHLVMHNYADNTRDRFGIKKLKDQLIDYDPTRTWVIEQTEFNLPTASGYWIYAKLNMADGSSECTLEVYEDHKEVKLQVETGYIKYKLGHISDKASPRYAAMLWGNTRTPSMSQVQKEIVDQVENNTTIIEAITNLINNSKGGYKESFIIEHTTNAAETQLSSWSVIAYNELMGEYKATVTVRDKDDDTMHTVMSVLSFDYTDPAAELSIQNDIITEAITTLVLGIDASKRLYATVETASDAKRIHFCFERCVLAQRAEATTGQMGLGVDMSAAGTLVEDTFAVMGIGVGMGAEAEEVESCDFVSMLNSLDRWFKMDDNISGSLVEENSNNGTEINVTKEQASVADCSYSYYFNGSNARAQLPFDTFAGDEFTIAFWVMIPSGASLAEFKYIFGVHHDGYPVEYGPVITITPPGGAGDFDLGVGTGTYGASVYSDPFNFDTWHRIAATYTRVDNGVDKSTIYVSAYRNGAKFVDSYLLVYDYSSSFQANAWAKFLNIGCRYYSGAYHDFQEFYIDDLKIYDHAINDEEAVCDYNEGKCW